MARSSPDRCMHRHGMGTGQHEFDQLCADLGIEHRLTPPMRPQTDGMVERFNSRGDLEQTILLYVTP